jgi:Uma2 family endonuclease
VTLSWPNHLLTLEEWDALPEVEGVRLELAEGLVVMSPIPLSLHQRAAMRLGYRIDEQLPRDLTAVSGVEVIVCDPPPTVRVPDVSVSFSRTVERNPARLRASDVLLAVELLSDGTRKVDKILKFSEYAEAGIPQYWIIDLDGPTSMLAYILVNGNYELSGEHTGKAALDVAGHPVSIDLPALTRR